MLKTGEDNQVETTNFSFEKFKNGVGTIHGFTLGVKVYSAVNKIQNYLINETRLGIPDTSRSVERSCAKRVQWQLAGHWIGQGSRLPDP